MEIPVYLDLECIPSQDETLHKEIADKITPPGNMSKAETIAKWEKETKPGLVAEAIKKSCFDARTGEIVSIAWRVGENPIEALTHGVNLPAPGGGLIDAFFRCLEADARDMAGEYARSEVIFIGHNIINFDLPYIWRRATILGVDKPSFWPRPSIAPWKLNAFDTMLEWAGSRGTVSLDNLCKTFGIKGKGGMSGDQVYDYWLAGRYSEIDEYCRDDVMRVYELHKRLR